MKQDRKNNWNTIRRLLRVLYIILVVFAMNKSVVSASDGSSYQYDGYYYDFWANNIDSPAAYQLKTEITIEHMGGVNLQSIDDVTVSHDNRIFIVDKLESRVNVLDADLNFIYSIKLIRNSEGKISLDDNGNQIMLSSPSGIYYHNKNEELYIADTEAKRIVVVDGYTFALKRIINTPKEMTGVTEFKPYKVTVDKADRIYVVVQSSYEGIIELNPDGSFSRYFGVNVPRVNLIDFFWKSLASDTQKEKMGRTYAPAFNNLVADKEGFIYAVTSDSSAEKMVFRLNSAGGNVIREESNYIVGDYYYQNGQSQFLDIAISDYGLYAVIDGQNGRIFIYNFDGELLNVFGGMGNHKGQFKKPTSINFVGYDLIVSDSELKTAYILTPSKFGMAALRANEEYYYGNWDKATDYFEESLQYNANYEIAYTGIGKNYLMKDQYEDAMYYFKLGNSRAFYSKAYNGYRSIQIKENFHIFVLVFVAAMGLLVYTEVRYHKKGGTSE